MEGQSGATRSIMDEVRSSDVQRDKMEGEMCVTQSIIDEFHSADMVKWKVEMALLEV